jgi:hypothetical protein
VVIFTETRPSGLVVARDSMDEEAVERALKRLDGRFTLQKRWEDGHGWVYVVIEVVSDSYAPIVLTWRKPLSSALIDKLQSLQQGQRNALADEDEHNAKLVETLERDRQAFADAVLEDHEPYVSRGRVSVSLGPMKKKPYWKRGDGSSKKPWPTSGGKKA